MKYFAIQALGRAILLLGGYIVFGVYTETGYFSSHLFSFLAFCSLILKLGAFPCHFWVLRVAGGLRSLPLFLFITWQKVAPFALIINLLENKFWLSFLAVLLGGLGSLVGALIGLNQTNLRTMLGASSISHTGWGLLACVYGSFWMYFGLYCLSFGLLLLFIIIGNNRIRGLTVARLRGLPPFLLFVGKWKVVVSAIVARCPFGYLVLLLLGAFLRLFFYLKFLYSFYLADRIQSYRGMWVYILAFGVFNIAGSFYLVFCC